MLTKKELEMRRTGIGASEISAVIGMSRWRTPVDVWIEKTKDEPPPDLNDIPAIYWGNRLEDVVAEEFRRRNGVKFKKETTTRHPDHEWMLATPDRLIVDKEGNVIGGLEVKTAGFRSAEEWGEGGTDHIPLEHVCQCMQNMMVFGMTEWNVAVLINGSDYREYKIPFSTTIANEIIETGSTFWQTNVIGLVAPPHRNLSDVKAIYPAGDIGLELTADAHIVGACMSLAAAKEAMKHAEARVDGLQAQVQAYMGAATALKDPFDGSVLATWKSSVAKAFDVKTLQANDPNTYAKYIELRPRRTFLLKSKGE